MKIYVHKMIYERAREVAHAQKRTKSKLVEDALARYLGMECVPLDDCDVFGVECAEEYIPLDD